MTEPRYDPNLPPGWTQLSGYTDEARGLRAYVKDGQVLVCGIPFDCDDEERNHSCDQMGCGWDHVLARFTLNPERDR